MKRIRFHDLRHSCAALLLSEGRELYDVSEWLGHSDVNITAKFYGHLDMKRKKDLGNTIGNSIGFKNVVWLEPEGPLVRILLEKQRFSHFS